MLIRFENRDYPFDFEDVDVRQLTVIKAHTGLSMAGWQRAIGEGDPQALQALLWAMKQQNGERSEAAQLNFRPNDLLRAVNDALMDDAIGKPASDPTKGKTKSAPGTARSAPALDTAE